MSAVVILGVAVFGALFRLFYWMGGTNKSITSFTDSIKDIRSELTDSMKEMRSELIGSMKEIRSDIKQIFHLLPSPVAAGQSPIILTEHGEKLSSQLDAKKWARTVAPKLLNKLEGYADFEIHEFCKSYTREMTVKEHPDVFRRSYEGGITEENMKSVLGIVLRDELLKLVETHEPGKG